MPTFKPVVCTYVTRRGNCAELNGSNYTQAEMEVILIFKIKIVIFSLNLNIEIDFKTILFIDFDYKLLTCGDFIDSYLIIQNHQNMLILELINKIKY